MMDVMNMDLVKGIESKLDRTKWKKWKFSDLVENIVEKVKPQESKLEHYIGLEHLDSGSLHIKRFGETASLIGDKLKIYKNDIIFAKRNAYLKRVSIAPFDAVASAHSLVLRPKPENVLPEFLPFFLLSEKFWERAIEISVGSLSPTINWKVLAKQEFLLPPKDQQAKLAKLLWAMDAVIERENFAYIKTKEYKKSLRKKLLKGKDNGSYNPLGFLGSFYPIKSLNEYASVKGRIGWKGLKQSEYVNDGPYLIASKHIEDGKIKWNECDMITEFRYDESPEIALKNGDVVFSKDGAIGNPAHIKKLPGKATINSTMMLIRPKKGLDSEYFYQILLSSYFERLKIRCLSGSAIPHIFQGDMKNFEFPLPDIEKQKQIGSQLKYLDDLAREFESKITSSKALQKSLINQVF